MLSNRYNLVPLAIVLVLSVCLSIAYQLQAKNENRNSSFKSPQEGFIWEVKKSSSRSFLTRIINASPALSVTNTNDSGAGSLRQAIIDATPGDTISFSLPAGSAITLTSGELLINKNLTIGGPGANALSVQRSSATGTPQFRIFKIASSNLNVTISGLTISNGRSVGGGAIENSSAGTVNIIGCVFLSNSADVVGGAIEALGFSDQGIASTLNIINSTIAGNSGSSGGGVYCQNTSVNITNSTISGNSGNNGAGINCQEANLNLNNSTVTGNSAPFGGGLYLFSSQANSTNSIVAGNSGHTGPDVFSSSGSTSPLTSQGYNLVGNNGDAVIFSQATDQIGTPAAPINPGIGPLAANGGTTLTRALTAGSRAIDRGRTVSGVTTDQRGLKRPVDDPAVSNASGGDGSDIGAFELQLSPTPTPSPVSTPTINSLSPASPQKSAGLQNITIGGNGFQPNLTASLSLPGGASVTLSGGQIQNVTSSAFTIVVALNASGTYGIKANNPDGGVSNTFNFNVQEPVPSPTPTPSPNASPAPGPATDSISYTYDSLNRLTRVTYASGPIITYSYDAAGNRTSMQVNGVATPTPTPTASPSPSPNPSPSPSPSPGPSPGPSPTPTGPLQLLLEAGSSQAAALDAVLFLRDPFPVVSESNAFNSGPDRNTRVTVFVSNLQVAQGESPAAVVINLVDGSNQIFDVPAEAVRSLAGLPFIQVIFRLPSNLAPGTCVLTIRLQSQSSNSGTIRIRI